MRFCIVYRKCVTRIDIKYVVSYTRVLQMANTTVALSTAALRRLKKKKSKEREKEKELENGKLTSDSKLRKSESVPSKHILVIALLINDL